MIAVGVGSFWCGWLVGYVMGICRIFVGGGG